MSSNGEVQVYCYESLEQGKSYMFSIRDFFERKDIERKVYFDKRYGLYITYKGKRYYEAEFKYI